MKLLFKKHTILMFKRSGRRGLGFSGLSLALIFVVEGFAQTENYAYKNEGRRDPFVPLISSSGYLINLEPEDKTALRLEGIMFDPKGDSMAIINGELVRVGESIGDAFVSTIETDRVIVIKDNQNIEIPLRKEE